VTVLDAKSGEERHVPEGRDVSQPKQGVALIHSPEAVRNLCSATMGKVGRKVLTLGVGLGVGGCITLARLPRTREQ
jgi:hypothetical protein